MLQFTLQIQAVNETNIKNTLDLKVLAISSKIFDLIFKRNGLSCITL